ncbi:MAG TPA: NAD-dependent epimerase/dehydratase family protein [Bacteroidales bacterium]|nr:NAD-dependent epimerase/dehydratase family protein [Bacteroidales bacterium]HSA43942.1 NAD-dependent epimerase/dehydratase family protein [Bacteroidales bacterium]
MTSRIPASTTRTILITGGAGFIGSALAARLISDPDNYVVIVDDLSTGSIRRLPNLPKTNWKFIRCNVNHYTDIAEVMHAFSFDYVFHYAAMVGVQRTQAMPIRVLQDLHGIENILSLGKNSGVKRIFFASSSEVYGEPVDLPQNEHTTPLNSRIPYAVVKNAGEAFLRSYKKEYDLDFTIFRFFNTYGPMQDKQFVMSRFLYQALRNEALTIYGDGSQTRTFLYIDDNIEATVNAFYGDHVINDVINIGGEQEVSMLELAGMMIKTTGSKSDIQFLPPLEEGDMTRRCPDITKMKQLIFRRKPVSIVEGISKLASSPDFIIQQFNGIKK